VQRLGFNLLINRARPLPKPNASTIANTNAGTNALASTDTLASTNTSTNAFTSTNPSTFALASYHRKHTS